MDREAKPRMSVLDHGYLELVEVWGSEERIIESARMSTGKGFIGWGPKHKPGCDAAHLEGKPAYNDPPRLFCGCAALGDEKLLRYLWINRHHTPFEMCGATFEVQAPIMVFRQWFTHRTQSRNEHSARYGPLPALDYLPTLIRCFDQDTTNKQAKGTRTLPGVMTPEEVTAWLTWLDGWQREGERGYQQALAIGVPSEVARGATTVFRYSKMRVSANLRNWLHFLGLRADSHAQWEIRQYAEALKAQLEAVFPRTVALFEEGRK